MTPLSFGLIGSVLPVQRKSLSKQSLGGSESALLYMALALAKHGHNVDVFANCPDPGRYKGVDFWDLETSARTIQSKEFDVCVCSRQYANLTMPSKSRQRWLWVHDMLAGDAQLEELLGSLWQTDQVCTVSQFHTAVYKEQADILVDKIWTSQNAVDWAAIRKAVSGTGRKPKRLIYAARPERGLDFLLKVIWPLLKEQDQDLELAICGYDTSMLEVSQPAQEFYQRINAMIESLPGVTNYGALTKDEYWKLLASSKLTVYPTEFPEVSCINALESMAAGTPIVTTHRFALTETVPYPGVAAAPHSDAYINAFVQEVQHLMTDDMHYKRLQRDGMQHVEAHYQWDQVASEWEHRAEVIFTERMIKYPRQIFERLLWNSDAVAARAFLTSMKGLHWTQEHDPWYAEALQRVNDDLDAHTRQHDGAEATPDTYAGTPAAEEWQVRGHVERLGLIVKALPEGPLGHVVDLAAGSGALLARVLDERGTDVTAASYVDFSPSLQEQAAALFMDHPHGEKVTLFNMSLADFRPNRPTWTKSADVVFAGEIFEHLIDPNELFDCISRIAKPGATIVLSVPSGPWDSTAWATERKQAGQRDVHHVQHYERQDILDIFGQQEQFSLTHMGSQWSFQGEPLGNWMITYKTSQIPYGVVDYERKFYRTVPRETVAACLITRNGEEDLRKCLNSILPVVDEIHVSDNGSTDKTLDIVREYQTLYSPRVFIHHDTPDPDGDGLGNFAAWRNHSISHTDADWILWIDCDEQLMGSTHLRKYLNAASLFNAYAIRQVHIQGVSVEQPETDRPQRAFRNHRGVEFLGVVHEQPYLPPPNTAIKPSLEMQEVDILHFGYMSEDIARHKALERNLPLLKKDRTMNPDRHIGPYLVQRDYLNLAQFRIMEQQGINQETVQYLRNAVMIYLDNYADEADIMHQHALKVEQRCLKILGSARTPVMEDWGVPFEVRLDLVIGLAGLPKQTDGYVETRWFASPAEYRAFMRIYAEKTHTDLIEKQQLPQPEEESNNADDTSTASESAVKAA